MNYHDYETLPAVDDKHPVVDAMRCTIPDDAPIWADSDPAKPADFFRDLPRKEVPARKTE